jgi:hypothetical protein
VLIGGRLIQGWNTFHNPAPAGGSQSQVAQLEARALHLPAPATHGDCRSGPYSSDGALGKGPVYGAAGATSSTGWGTYFHNLLYADASISGPVVVRATDIFTHQRVVFVGMYAGGPIVGQDTIDGVLVDQRAELVFDSSQASKAGYLSQYKFAWPVTAGVPTNWSGSSGWQIDGVGFSEVFVAC